jgi:hypothetical protein
MTNARKRKQLLAKKRRKRALAVEKTGHHALELTMAAPPSHEASRASIALAAP